MFWKTRNVFWCLGTRLAKYCMTIGQVFTPLPPSPLKAFVPLIGSTPDLQSTLVFPKSLIRLVLKCYIFIVALKVSLTAHL